MSTAVFTSFDQQTDSEGNPLDGGSVTVYQAGTTTTIQLYNDDDLAGGHETSNPITLLSDGRHAITYFSTQAYKVLVKDSSGNTIYTRDNIDPGVPVGTGALPIANGGTGATSAPTALSNLGAATAAELADLSTEVAALSGALASTEKTHIATGTTAQRPASPIEGDIRRNTTTARWEAYNGTSWQNLATSPFTRQIKTSGTAATYTTPAGCVKILVKMIGGGGGGGATITNNGGTGGTTIFNAIEAAGGSGGLNGNTSGPATGGAGGTGGAGSATRRMDGNPGQHGIGGSGADALVGRGGNGGAGIFGGGGRGGTNGVAGTAAAANSGAGGGGSTIATQATAGGGGGAGEYVELEILGPSSTYTYTVGAAGAAGAAGTNAGYAGGTGVIIVEEYY